jgi:hypothetical protein
MGRGRGGEGGEGEGCPGPGQRICRIQSSAVWKASLLYAVPLYGRGCPSALRLKDIIADDSHNDGGCHALGLAGSSLDRER